MSNPEQSPSEGGTWLRLPDGSLQKVEDTPPAAPEPVAPVANTASQAKKIKE